MLLLRYASLRLRLTHEEPGLRPEPSLEAQPKLRYATYVGLRPMDLLRKSRALRAR